MLSPASARWVATSVWALCLIACSSKKPGDGATAGTGGSVALEDGGLLGTGGNAGNSTTVRRDDAGNCIIEGDGTGCTGEAYEGESIPLDIYIMFDQSGSMCACVDPVGQDACTRTNGVTTPDPDCNQTRMDAVREATRLFMADRDSSGIGVGIGYFGKQEIGSTSCNVADYAAAAVPIGVLPDHATAVNALSLAAIQPIGETPTAPAIRGACQYAQSYQTQNPSHVVVMLLLTDGKPEAPTTCPRDSSCCPTLPDAVAAATECLTGNPPIKTYVLGVGPLLSNLTEIAVAGGTSQAYLVEGGDVTNQVLAALNAIRGDAIPCQFQIPAPPPDTVLDYSLVNVTYASPGCEPTYYYNVQTVSSCATAGGWYYDDPANPQQINLCPTSCDQVAAPGGRLVYTLGCTTRILPH